MSSKLAYFVFIPGFNNNNRSAFCVRLRDYIVKNRQQQQFPIIRYEPGKGKECYVGVGVEMGLFDDNDEARQLLGEAVGRVIPNYHWKPLYVKDVINICKVLRSPVNCEGFTTRLIFEQRVEWAIAASIQLRENLDDPSSVEVEIQNTLSVEHNRLLYWCSCVGSGDLARLVAVVKSLGTLPEGAGIWSLLRRMIVLGHLEVARTSSGWRWSIAPPVRITPASGGPAFSAGRRLPSDLNAEGVVSESQKLGPDITSCPAWEGAYSARRIIDRLPKLDDFIASASAWNETDFTAYIIKRIDDDKYIIAPEADPFGVHLFERDGRLTWAWFDKTRNRWIVSDPLTISFLHRATAGLAIAALDEEDSLIIPWSDRWPIPYERAMVLCSGKLPLVICDNNNNLLLKYKGIPRELATQVAGNLGVQLGGNNA